jgi:hypothetical protein
MIMTVNCRFLKPLDQANQQMLFYADGFQRFMMRPIVPLIVWAFVKFL